MSTGTTVATEKKPTTLLQTIGGEAFKEQIAMALPRHMTPDRFARIAITAIRKVPKLMLCTPESVLSCLMNLSQYGLEPDGRRAHLIPFENRKTGTFECTLIVDYKGLVELALRSGMVATLHADVVSAGDLFEYSLGKIIGHTPWFLRRDADKPTDPGKVYAVYATCENKDGTTKSEVLSLSEVENIRARSKSGNSGPWVTDWSEMAKKTAFKRLSKWLVLSPEFRDAVDKDDEDVIETTAIRHERSLTKVGQLVASGAMSARIEADVPEHATEGTSRVSHRDACCEWLKAQEGVALDQADPEAGTILFSLPNDRFIILTDAPMRCPDGIDLVLATDSDAVSQCQNIVEDARKTR